jgi:hypothetical protein
MSTDWQPGQTGRVIADYTCAYPDPLVMRTGEQLIVGERDTQWPEFVWCVNSVGKGGWVPDKYIERVGEAGIARCDYTAQLTATADEELVLDHAEGGWFWATNRQGRSGWIPAEHIELI